MTNEGQHKLELWLLWLLAMAIIGAVLALALVGTSDANSIHNAVITGLLPVLPIAINGFRQVRQSQAMQAMAQQLGQSAPAQVESHAPLDLTGAEMPGSEK